MFPVPCPGNSLRSLVDLAGVVQPMTLAGSRHIADPLRTALVNSSPRDLFPGAPYPEAAMAGLWLYFSRLDEAHEIAQRLDSREGSFWHAIMHRREPDAANAAYWFRRVGRHSTFPAIAAAARKLGYPAADWDPFAFIEFCDQKPGSAEELLAVDVQLVEWRILFAHCVGASTEPAE
jgi:hypothetical protein